MEVTMETDETPSTPTAYEVPTYELRPGDAWFHFLHGNVPGHQIDFIYRPRVPQAPLTRQHFSHLSRLMKYIEPRRGSAYAFEIGNLSRDDTQFEPGHGAVALIFGLRIKGAVDHAGRQDPPFCHSAVLVDRHLDGEAIYATSTQFYQRLLPDDESRAEGSGWYHTYVQYAQNPDALVPLLRGYLSDFEDLAAPGPSELALRWSVEKSTPPPRVVIVYPDRADFSTIAYCMARIANVLVASDIKWTAISNGREQDVAGGLTVRFVPRREATTEPPDVVLMHLEQVPEDPATIAAQLFNAYDTWAAQPSDPRPGTRSALERIGPPSTREHRASATSSLSATQSTSSKEERARPWAPPPPEPPPPPENALGFGGLVQVVEKAAEPAGTPFAQPDLTAALKKKQRRQQFSTLIGVAVLIVLMGVIAAIWFGSEPPSVSADPAPSATSAAPGTASSKPSGAITSKSTADVRVGNPTIVNESKSSKPTSLPTQRPKPSTTKPPQPPSPPFQ